MRRFERGNNSFKSRERLRSLYGFLVAHRRVFRALLIGQPCVLRANRWVIKPCRHRMRRRNLAVSRLQHVCVCSLQHAGTRSRESFSRSQARRMLAERFSAPARFDPEQLYALFAEKRVEKPNRIRAAADACHQQIGQASLRPA